MINDNIFSPLNNNSMFTFIIKLIAFILIIFAYPSFITQIFLILILAFASWESFDEKYIQAIQEEEE